MKNISFNKIFLTLLYHGNQNCVCFKEYVSYLDSLSFWLLPGVEPVLITSSVLSKIEQNECLGNVKIFSIHANFTGKPFVIHALS